MSELKKFIEVAPLIRSKNGAYTSTLEFDKKHLLEIGYPLYIRSKDYGITIFEGIKSTCSFTFKDKQQKGYYYRIMFYPNKLIMTRHKAGKAEDVEKYEYQYGILVDYVLNYWHNLTQQ